MVREQIKKEIEDILNTAIMVDDNCKVISKADKILAIPDLHTEAVQAERERIVEILEDALENDFVNLGGIGLEGLEGITIDPSALEGIRQALRGEV